MHPGRRRAGIHAAHTQQCAKYELACLLRSGEVHPVGWPAGQSTHPSVVRAPTTMGTNWKGCSLQSKRRAQERSPVKNTHDSTAVAFLMTCPQLMLAAHQAACSLVQQPALTSPHQPRPPSPKPTHPITRLMKGVCSSRLCSAYVMGQHQKSGMASSSTVQARRGRCMAAHTHS